MIMNASHAAHKIKKMSKEHQIVMLPSEKPSQLHILKEGKLITFSSPKERVIGLRQPQHLYILSDEEIKVGDWIVEYGFVTRYDGFPLDESDKKIIATTDTELLTCKGVKREGESCSYNNNCKYPSCKLPQIPQHIIEAYVKKPFDKVVVEYPDYILKTRVMRCPYYWDKQGKCMRRGKCLCAVVEPKLNQDGTLAVSLVESGYYAIYDEVTNKTLHIQAPSLKDAEIIAAAIDFDNFVDGQSILTNPSVSLVEEKIEVDKLKLIEGLGRLRLTSDEELRAKYPLKPQVGMGIDWDKWIKENL